MGKTLAFYTAFFGNDSNWTNVIYTPPSKNDCYYFTNNINTFKKLNETGWIGIFIDNIPIHNSNVLDAFSSKDLKANPHKNNILKTYDYTCWLDCKNYVDSKKVRELVDLLDKSDKCVVLSKHSHSKQINSVWDEFTLSMNYQKYASEREKYEKYIKDNLNSGEYSEKIPVRYCSNIWIRKMCPKTVEMSETWYNHIIKCGIECQIALGFVQQKYEDIIYAVEYQYCWSYDNIFNVRPD